ncbi:hypothetical protein U0T99_13830 [Vibrio hannami]
MTFKLSAATVFVVDSYHAEYLWTSECRRGLESVFNDQHQLTYAEMDTKRIPSSEFANRGNDIWQKILLANPDIVITMDDNALKYLGQRVSDAGIPLVFMGVNNDPKVYFNNGAIPPNVSGVLERPLLKQNLKFLLPRLLDLKAHRTLLLMDSGVTSEAIVNTYRAQGGRDMIGGVQLDFYLANDFKEWQEKINSLSIDDYDAVLISSYSRLKNENGDQVSSEITTEWTSVNSNIPVFAFWRYSVGKNKAIGGFVNSGYKQGELAANIVDEILSVGTIPYIEKSADGEYLFSQYELERWGLKLPNNVLRRAELLE